MNQTTLDRAVNLVIALLAVACTALAVVAITLVILGAYLGIWTVGDDSGRWAATAFISALVAMFAILGAAIFGSAAGDR